MSYSVKSVSLGVFLWLRQAGNMALFCNEVSTVRWGAFLQASACMRPDGGSCGLLQDGIVGVADFLKDCFQPDTCH
jgi:hypothetical protein